jgi:capsular polysaccharide biosynthesis protein
MTYKILSTRQQDTILFTEVEYNFDGTIVNVEVAHFNPQSTSEVAANIIDRAQSELDKITIANQITNLIPSIEINQTNNI